MTITPPTAAQLIAAAATGDVGEFPAAAIAPDGTLHVAYRGFEDGSITHAQRPAAGNVGPSPRCRPDPGEQ